MSNKKTYQLKDLKDHEVSPPAFLYDRIKDSIEKEEENRIREMLSPLSDHALMPPEESSAAVFSALADEKIRGLLQPLKEHSVPPPVQFKTPSANVKSSPVKSRVVSLRMFKKVAAAAAVIAFIVVTYIMVQQNSPADRPVADHIGKTLPGTIAAKPPTIITKTPAPVITGSVKKIIASSLSVQHKVFVVQPGTDRKNSSPVISIDGSSYAVKNNDYLAMLTSFNESRMPAFLQSADPLPVMITVDQYSSIAVSENMAAILKKTYRTKRNGKPTRKAKKQKEKIEKWKKADEEYFNKNSTMNPLDPIDLGDFILYK